MSPTSKPRDTYTGSHRKPGRWQRRTPASTPSPRERFQPANAARTTRWTAPDIRALGVTTDLRTAASILGLKPHSAYPINARGAFPVPVIKVGGRYRVPVAPILDLLGIHRWPAQS